MKKIFTLFILVFLSAFQSCENKTEKKNNPKNEVQKSNDDLNSVSIEKAGKIIKYAISVEKTDSVEYHSAELKVRHKNNGIKITDFNKAKKFLRGIVEFDEGEDGESQAIKKIHFRNGKEYLGARENSYFFVAYYPEEDILLCEGGHSSDVSFNLKNGKETEETGNPDLIISSLNKEFRINGHYGGQECYSYFIQRKINGEFEKIIQLDEEFEKQTKIWLCIIGSAFWLDDKTIYLTESSNFTDEGLKKRYFRIKITWL